MGNGIQWLSARIQVGWLKGRAAPGLLCDQRVPTKLKGKFYITTIRLVILYGTECRDVKKQHVTEMSVTEMVILK